MTVRFGSSTIGLAIILIAGGLAAAQAQPGPGFVEQVDVSDEAVTFHTKGAFEGFVMTVSGPGGFLLRRHFAGEEAPRLDVTTEEGVRLADGPYTIEVTARPKIPEDRREALERARAEGDRGQVRRLLAEAGIQPDEMVFTTGVGVAGGRFLDPGLEEHEAGGGTGAGNGASAVKDGGPTFGSVRLTGRRWDAAVLPGGHLTYVAAPDATGAALRNTLLADDDRSDAPPFLTPDPAAAWHEATFENKTADGTPLSYEGYLRLVRSDGQAKLFQAYFREAAANGAGPGPWVKGYFRADGEGFRFLDQVDMARPAVKTQAPLFDYVAQEDGPAAAPEARPRDQVINDDLIVTQSACVGFDCVNGESFGFDTIRIKENNLRIKADDTSSTAAFPSGDWQITFNDTANGGASRFSIDDVTGGRTPFTIEAGAPSHALYVDDGGRVGFGTATPVVRHHVVDGNTPTVRLEQNGSSGFSPQTWDVAGNEANFFIRDLTSGSRLPLRIRPGAPTSSLDISASGGIGIGTESLASGARVHVENTSGDDTDDVIITEDGNVGIHLIDPNQELEIGDSDADANANVAFRLRTASHQWDVAVLENNGNFTFTKAGAGQRATIDPSGNLILAGNCSDAAGGGGCTPDYVFEPDYEMLTLDELEAFINRNRHLPNVPSAAEIERKGFNVRGFNYALLEKIEELTLYTIQQQKTIEALEARLEALEAVQQGSEP